MSPPGSSGHKIGGSGPLKPGDLVVACEAIVRLFNPAMTTVDAHAGDFVQENRITDAEDKKFLHQVLYGCIRYKKMLKIFLSSFYFKHGGETQRNDYTLYMVLAYLGIMRMDELTFPEFRRLVLSQDHIKMRVFMKFLFNEDNLNKWMKDEWIKLFDPQYVQEMLIGEVVRFIPDVDQLVAFLDERIAGTAAKKEAQEAAVRALAEGRGGGGKHTTPTPFQITEPKPRLVPEPEEVIDLTFKAKKVPPSTYAEVNTRKDIKAIDKAKDENRLKMKEKYSDPRKQPFKLKVLERPSNMDKIKQEVEAERQAELKFDDFKATEAPRHKPSQGYVKLNTAAILREDNLYRKKQQEEAQMIKAYEEELHDASKFSAWQADMRARDEAKRREEIERRRVEMALADEEAKAARQNKIRENKTLVAQLQVEQQVQWQKHQQELEKVVEENKALVEDVIKSRENVGKANREMLKRNRSNAQDVRAETERLEQERAEARRLEEERRQDMIRQIKALEMVPQKREVELDPTYTPGYGLLEEMSLAELRERINITRQRQQQAEEEKRSEIINAKQQAAAELAERVQNLSQIRRLAANQGHNRRDDVKKELAKRESIRKEKHEEAQLKLHAEIEKKRAARHAEEMRLAEELHQIKIKNQFLEANKDAVEEKKWLGQELGALREVKARQKVNQESQHDVESIRSREHSIRLQNKDTKEQQKELFLAQLKQKELDAQLEADDAADELHATRSINAERERQHKVAARAVKEDLYPYSKQISEEQKDKATKYVTKRMSMSSSTGLVTRVPSA